MQTPYIPHVFGELVEQKLRSRVGWLSAAVASSVSWPTKDVWIQYAGDDFILHGTQDGERPNAPAISVPGSQDEIQDALARVYRLSSVLSWFLGGYVDVVSQMHGSRPVRFAGEMRQAFTTLQTFGGKSFNCNYMPIIEQENVRIALAFWREGERLRGVHDSYAFLSYFKVLESQFQRSADRVEWFNRNIDLMAGDAAVRVADIRAVSGDVGRHLYDSGRNAVAHASFGGGIVDPDIPADRRRIAADLVLMRELAKRFIATELGVPTRDSLFESRDRLVPWDSLIEPDALATLRAGQTPAGGLGLDRQVVSVGLWPDGPLPGLEQMTLRVDVVHEGAVRVLLFNPRMTLLLVFVLDYRHGRVHTQLEQGGLLRNENNQPDEADVRALATLFHRVIANAVVELHIDGLEPVECEVVIPVNIIPRNPEEAIAEAVEAFRNQQLG